MYLEDWHTSLRNSNFPTFLSNFFFSRQIQFYQWHFTTSTSPSHLRTLPSRDVRNPRRRDVEIEEVGKHLDESMVYERIGSGECRRTSDKEMRWNAGCQGRGCETGLRATYSSSFVQVSR